MARSYFFIQSDNIYLLCRCYLNLMWLLVWLGLYLPSCCLLSTRPTYFLFHPHLFFCFSFLLSNQLLLWFYFLSVFGLFYAQLLSSWFWVCMCACSVASSRVQCFSDPSRLLTRALQAPLSMELSRQEYWNGLPFLPPGNLPDPKIETVSPMSPALADRFFTTVPYYIFNLLQSLNSSMPTVMDGRTHNRTFDCLSTFWAITVLHLILFILWNHSKLLS